MVIEEFLKELDRVRHQFEWVLRADEGLHHERRSRPRYKLRCSAWKGPAEGITLDPVGAVCYASTRTLYEHDYWEDAAKAIDLPLADASKLMAAADDRTWIGREGERQPDPHLESLRATLIDTVGLTVSNL